MDKIKELERKCQEFQSIAYDAKEKLAQGQAEYQIKMVVLDDESRRLKQKHRDELKEYDANKLREIERTKEEFHANENNLRDRLSKLENSKHLLEDVSLIFIFYRPTTIFPFLNYKLNF